MNAAPAPAAQPNATTANIGRNHRMIDARLRQQRSRPSILTCLGAVSCLIAVSLGTPTTSFSSTGELTSEDKRLLAKGELVMKEKNEQRGAYKLFGGQSWQIINAPTSVTWATLQDLSGYKNFIPLATESVIKHQDPEETDVAIRQQWGPIDIRYVLQTSVQNEKGAVVFRVDHSQDHDIRAGWGFIRVRPYKKTMSLVSFGALVDIGDGVFVSIVRPAVRRDLLRIPYFLKNHIEGGGEVTSSTNGTAAAD
jgi:ribosome-associated toxin RatA of RatAB toxin-antitoxin module